MTKDQQTRKDIIYDLETYPNCFTFCAVFANGKGLRVYEISDRKDETDKMLEFLRNLLKNQYRMVGFNCLAFDYPIMHHILLKAKKAFKDGKQPKFTAKELYGIAQDLIEGMKSNDRFGNSIKDSEIIISQVDLYKIWHFDNKARSTSLKMLEFNMRSENIEDLPFPVGTNLDDKQKAELIKYNKHDVLETLKFYRYSQEALKLREELTELFGFDCTNFNDTKIGKQLFINSLEKAAPGCCYAVTERGRKIRQTKRDKIVIKDCLFPYIKFKRPEFQALHEWFKRQVITETKGVFADIEEHDLGELAQYAELVVKRKKFKGKPTDEERQEFLQQHPLGWIEEEELKATEYVFDENGEHVMEYPLTEFGLPDESKKPKKKRRQKISYWGCWKIAETLNVVINGFRYDEGLGGVHGSISGKVEEDDNFLIIDCDVSSMYPNLAISNNAHPAHLGTTFCKVYKRLYDERKSHPKGSAANAALKLALNGVYGDSGNEYSPLYDPAYMMSITCSGQMSILMLVERLIDVGCEVIQCNTDGVTCKVPKSKENDYYSACRDWESVVKLDLEYCYYSKMFIRDCNNYIAVYKE